MQGLNAQVVHFASSQKSPYAIKASLYFDAVKVGIFIDI